MATYNKPHRTFSFIAFQAGLNTVDTVSLRFRPVWLLYGAAYIAAFLVVVVVAQLAYPRGISTPKTYLGTQRLGFASAARVRGVAENGSKQIDLIAGDGSKTPFLLERLGLAIDGKQTARELTNYPFKERLVPFSILRTKRLDSSIKSFDQTKLPAITPKLQELFSEQPVSARLVVQEETARIVPEQSGSQIDEALLAARIKETADGGNQAIILPVQKLQPKVLSAQLSGPKEAANKILAKKLTITAGQFTQTLTRTELQNWVAIGGTIDEVPVVGIDDAAAVAYIDSLKKHVEAGGIPAHASFLDNEIQLVVNGKPGQGLVADQTLQELKNALLGEATEAQITVSVATIEPGRVNQHQYTQTSKGLQALLTNALKGKPGRYYAGVEVLSAGDDRVAAVNADIPTVSASLYKLFVANVLFEYLHDGRLSWSTVLPTGQTIDHCFEQMIVYSQDRCAIALAQTMGWATIDERLQALGYPNTRLNNYNANGTLNGSNKQTSVQDLMHVLRHLNDGTLVSADLSQRLVNSMKRQIYRSGIPVGARSVVVNKVGYIDGYFNDAGIIYGKNKTYALVLLSAGGYWTGISNITTQLENYFNN